MGHGAWGMGHRRLGDFKIKKYPKTDAKTLSISPLSVSGVVAYANPLCVYVYLDNLFLGNL